MCSCIMVCAGVCALCGGVCVCADVEGSVHAGRARGPHSSIYPCLSLAILYHSLSYSFEARSLSEPGTHTVFSQLGQKPTKPPQMLPSPPLSVKALQVGPGYFACQQVLAPHACQQGLLPTELSLEPHKGEVCHFQGPIAVLIQRIQNVGNFRSLGNSCKPNLR